MLPFAKLLNSLAALLLASLCVFAGTSGALSEDNAVESLFEHLRTAAPDEVNAIERRILELWSDSGSPTANLLLQRGRAAMAMRKFDTASKHLRALTDLAPEFAEGWNARATLYYLVGKPVLSTYMIAKTLALNPKHFGALSGLGMIFEQQGETERALAAYLAVQALSPNRASIAEAIARLKATSSGQAI